MNTDDLLHRIGKPRILVIGDLMLDRYTWGNADRVSPEAPVLVLRTDEQELRLGGAASVAMLLRSLEADVTLAGVIGDDPSGRLLTKLLDDDRIDRDLVVSVHDRPTTTKERFVGRAANRHPHQILRVDSETREEISGETVEILRDGILRQLPDYSAVIISDYAKGACAPSLLENIIQAARTHGIPVIVDPPRIVDYSRYRGASLLTPNRQEAEFASGLTIASCNDAIGVARRLAETYRADSVFVTLDRDGIAIFGENDGGPSEQIAPAQPREVYDITGAGDMVVATTGICLGAGLSLAETAHLANIAAGWEIEQVGVAPVTWSQIQHAIQQQQISSDTARADLANTRSSCAASAERKIATLNKLVAWVATYSAQDRKIVFTNGCFDLLHVGHVSYLQEAAALGDVLIVAINSDRGVRKLKGAARPVVQESDRAKMLAALSCVDHVLIFDDDTPHRLLDLLRPDVLVKGGSTAAVVGREVVEAYGGEVCVAQCVEGVSTTDIVAHIKSHHDKSAEKHDIVLATES